MTGTHFKERNLVPWKDETWSRSEAFSYFLIETGSRAVLDFFLKGNRGDDFFSFLDEPDYSTKTDESLSANSTTSYTQMERLDYDKMKYEPSRSDEEFFYNRKIVVDAFLKERSLKDLERPFQDSIIYNTDIDEDDGKNMLRSLIDVPGGSYLLLNKSIPDEWYREIWKNVDDFKDQVIKKVSVDKFWYKVVPQHWIAREGKEKDKDGKLLWDIDKEGFQTLLGIDDEKLTRGIVFHAANAFSQNIGKGKYSYNVTKKQGEKYMKKGVKFFTDLAMHGTENAMKAIVDKIDDSHVTTEPWIFDEGWDCALLRVVKEHANHVKTVERANDVIDRYCSIREKNSRGGN